MILVVSILNPPINYLIKKTLFLKKTPISIIIIIKSLKFEKIKYCLIKSFQRFKKKILINLDETIFNRYIMIKELFKTF